MEIKREYYLNKLISKKANGLIKIITGIRRCGKSYLLFNLYHNYLNSIGIDEAHIIELSLDDISNIKYRNPLELYKYLKSLVEDKDGMFYIFLDEIQKVESINNPFFEELNEKITFIDVLLDLMKFKNVDIYVTGSNSKMLSSDILTEFRDRGDEIRLYPLSYREICLANDGVDKNKIWEEYIMYGGMPRVVLTQDYEEKSRYLKDLFLRTYLKDIIERHDIRASTDILEDLINFISSAVGSLTNPKKLADTFKSEKKINITSSAISNYLDYFIDAFLLYKANKYDIKGRKYISTPLKYYFSDVGIRNARLNFRQQEENHIMENIIYNELVMRGFNVDVGALEYTTRNKSGKNQRVQLEVDFIVNKGSSKYYIQSALNIINEEKRKQEINSLVRIDDSFKKIFIVKDAIIPWHDENGILYLGVQEFLLKEDAINL